MHYKKQRGNKILLLLSAGAILFGCLSLSCFPAARFSARENRVLAAFPQPSVASVADGNYTAALDAYATDRFPFRIPLRTARSGLLIATGRQEAGDVLLCTDGSLCKRAQVNERAYQKNLTVLQDLCATYGDRFTVAIAPRRIDARAEVLPSLYDNGENAAPWSLLQHSLPNAVTFSMLTADAHWYRTDHHWTTQGAYQAYRHLGQTLGYAPLPEESFTAETVSTTFYGTSHAAAGIPFITPDTIQLYRYDGDVAYTVKKDGEPAPFTGFYDRERLNTHDGYGVFFGGNCGTLEITDQTERPTLLVIKDSFANALLPFLARHFHVIALDPRYEKADLATHAATADRILFLCGMQTLTAPLL